MMKFDTPEFQKAIEKIRFLLSTPAAQNDCRLQRYYAQFIKRQSEKKLKRILEYIKKKGYDNYNPHGIRIVDKNDPISKGEIPLGHDSDYKNPVYLTLDEMVRSALICAEPGAGKTSELIPLIESSIHHGINPLIFVKKLHQFEYIADPNNEPFTVFGLNELRYSMFECDDETDFTLWCQFIAGLIVNIYSLQNSAGYLLKAAKLLAADWPLERRLQEGFPTCFDLSQKLTSLKTPYHDKKYIHSANTILMTISESTDLFHARNGMYQSILSRPTIVYYEPGKTQLVELLLSLMAYRFKNENQRLQHDQRKYWLIIWDDAQEFLLGRISDRLPPIVELISILREFLLGFIFSFQTLKQIDPQIAAIPCTRIVGRLSDAHEAYNATKILGIDETYAPHISILNDGQFLVKSPNSQGVVLFKGIYKPIPFPKDLQQWMLDNEQRKSLYQWTPFELQQDESFSKNNEDISELETRIFWQILNHPFDTRDEHQKSLSLSSSTINKNTQKLVDRQYLKKHKISHWVAYEILEQGWIFSNQKPTVHKGGYPHEFAVDRIQRMLNANGFTVQREQTLPPTNHPIDLVAIKDGIIVAVEIETGKSNIVSNILNCKKTTANQIVIVGITDITTRKICKDIKDNPELEPSVMTNRLQVISLWNFLHEK